MGNECNYYRDETVDVKAQFGSCFQLSHDGHGVVFGKNGFLLHQEDGQGEAEQYFGTFQQEAVPNPQQRLWKKKNSCKSLTYKNIKAYPSKTA